MGIGEDWNDLLLDDIAKLSGGVSDYISSPRQIREVFMSRLNELATIILRQVKLSCNLASYVKLHAAFRVQPYMEQLNLNPTANGELAFDLGHLSEDQPQALVFEWVVEAGTEQGERRLGRIELTGVLADSRESVSVRRDVKVNFMLKPPEEEVPARLVNLLARLSVFRLQEQAWRVLEAGDTRRATSLLESAATRLFDMGYPDLGHIAMLEAERIEKGEQVTSKGRKQMRYGTRSLTIGSSR